MFRNCNFFIYKFFQLLFSEWKPYMANVVWKDWEAVKIEMKKNCYWNTVRPEPIWVKVKKSWLLLPQHQSTYPRCPESVSIEIPPFKPQFLKFSKNCFLLSKSCFTMFTFWGTFTNKIWDWCSFWASWVHTLILW